MKCVKMQQADVAVIIGRFQVHELHEEHRRLIDEVLAKHERVLMFLGVSELRNSKRNPLDFNARKQMIQEDYPSIEIYCIDDKLSNSVWSKELDTRIGRLTSPDQTVLLYGGRDSFIKHYSGIHRTCELEPKIVISGTELRRRVSIKTQPSKDFRAGAIWASYNRYNTVYPTVDVAILRNGEVLLGKKYRDNGLYRFVGGFADPNSLSYEADARREAREETGLEVGDLKYLGSTLIDDWRYRGEEDKIKTIFFSAEYVYGSPEASDDLDGLGWFKIEDIFKVITPEHLDLATLLLTKYPQL